MVSRKFSIIKILVWVLLGLSPSWAADLSAKLNKQQITLGESVELTVEYQGESASPHIDLSPLNRDFRVSQVGSQQSVSILNGRASAMLIEQFELTPKKEGHLTVGPILADGLKAEPLSLEVLEPAQMSRTVQPKDPNKPLTRPPIWVEAGLSEQKAFPRQKVTYTAAVYREPDLPEVKLELPNFNGFITTEPRTTTEMLKERGKDYLVKKVSVDLFPTAEGYYQFDPARVVYNGRYVSGLQSGSFPLQVKPLPKKGRPSDFHGAVGSYSLAASGQGQDLVVTVKGESLPGWSPEVTIPSFPGMKVLDKQVEESAPGETTVVYQMSVPTGGVDLGAVSLSYFDPAQGKYLRAESNPVTLEARSQDNAEREAPLVPKLTLQELTLEPPHSIPNQVWLLALLLPWLAVLLGLVVPAFKNYLAGDGLDRAYTAEELAQAIRRHPQAEKMQEAIERLEPFRFGREAFTESARRSIVEMARKGRKS